MAFVVNGHCIDVKTQTCVSAGPVSWIDQGNRMPYVSPFGCADCGACEQHCPGRAVAFEKNLPPRHRESPVVNSDFLSSLGNPFGARRVGALGSDQSDVELMS